MVGRTGRYPGVTEYQRLAGQPPRPACGTLLGQDPWLCDSSLDYLTPGEFEDLHSTQPQATLS
jgi:hypothetical protein